MKSGRLTIVYYFIYLIFFQIGMVYQSLCCVLDKLRCKKSPVLWFDLDMWRSLVSVSQLQLLFTLRHRMLPLLVMEMKIKSISAGMRFHDQIYRHQHVVMDSMSRKSKRSTHITFAWNQPQFAELFAEKMCGWITYTSEKGVNKCEQVIFFCIYVYVKWN